MELKQQIEQQRVKHIISSYQLEGEDAIGFHQYLNDLLATYPSPVIELALVEVLVGWLATVANAEGLRVPDADPRSHHFLARTQPHQFDRARGISPDHWTRSHARFWLLQKSDRRGDRIWN